MNGSDHEKLTEQEILDSLTRSGYLFESEITKTLFDYGFFVESNITSLDPFTGKNREIDLLAEYNEEFDQEKIENKVFSIVRFVFEIKNNNAPLVLLTKHEYSPLSYIYNGLKSAVTIPKNLKDIYYPDFFSILFNPEKRNLHTQYCSFSKKKNEELMAHHPEYIYTGLQKITHFCEERLESWRQLETTHKDSYFRDILYLPVLLIKDELFELNITDDNKRELKKVETSQLVFNYHYKQEPKTAIVYIVTKEGLKPFLNELVKTSKQVEENMLNAKKQFLERNAK